MFKVFSKAKVSHIQGQGDIPHHFKVYEYTCPELFISSRLIVEGRTMIFYFCAFYDFFVHIYPLRDFDLVEYAESGVVPEEQRLGRMVIPQDLVELLERLIDGDDGVFEVHRGDSQWRLRALDADLELLLDADDSRIRILDYIIEQLDEFDQDTVHNSLC